MLQTLVTIRDVAGQTTSVPSAVTLLLADRPGLFAEQIMEPIEKAGAYVVGSRVDVFRRDRSSPIAEIDIVVDSRYLSTEGVVAAIERTTGVMGTSFGDSGETGVTSPSTGNLLWSFDDWKRVFLERDLPRGLPSTRKMLQFTWDQPMYPVRTFGVENTNQAIKTREGTMMPMSSMFRGRASKALENRPMYSESRFAWAFLDYGANIEFCQAQIVRGNSGRQHRLGSMVVSFPSEGAMRNGASVKDALMDIFEFRRGNRIDPG